MLATSPAAVTIEENAMTANGSSDDRAVFRDSDLSGSRITGADLSGAVMRGVEVNGLQIDTPWLFDEGCSVWVNGVDIVPLVDAELDRRFPGRAERHAADPAGLRSAWAAVEQTWASTLERVARMPAGTVDVSVDGEWSFAQTLRHLVMATDVWLRQAIQGISQPYHPMGLSYAEFASDGYDTSVFSESSPSFDEVLAVRAGRIAMVRDFLADVTPDELARPCPHPWAPGRTRSALSCLHTILREEWEHHRYAVRDLDVIESS